jgi:hypothetical protein
MNASDRQACDSDSQNCPTTWAPLQGYERPKFDLNFFALLVGLAAFWVALAPWQTWHSLGVLAVFLLTFLFGCGRTRWATLAIAPSMVIPYAWIFFNQVHPWNDYRRQWLAQLFELPGVIAPIVARAQGGSGGALQDGLTAAVTAALLFLLLVTGARINRQWLLAMTFLSLNLNLLNSLVAWGIYKQG